MEAKLETLAKHPEFDADFRERLQALLAWRRDVRRFRRDPLPPGTIERLIGIACLSPSVGLSEPWRFVIVDDQRRRAAIRASFEVVQSGCAQATGAGSRLALCAAEALRPRRRAVSDRRVRRPHDGARPWARAPHHARDARLLRGHRHSHALARGAGGRDRRRLGVDPRSGERLPRSWRCREDWTFIGHLCIGYPEEEHDMPALQRADWERRHPAAGTILYR